MKQRSVRSHIVGAPIVCAMRVQGPVVALLPPKACTYDDYKERRQKVGLKRLIMQSNK